MALFMGNFANRKTSAPAGQASRGLRDELNHTMIPSTLHHLQPPSHVRITLGLRPITACPAGSEVSLHRLRIRFVDTNF